MVCQFKYTAEELLMNLTINNFSAECTNHWFTYGQVNNFIAEGLYFECSGSVNYWMTYKLTYKSHIVIQENDDECGITNYLMAN